MATHNTPPRFKYPENVGQKPYDKWILFEAKAGRRIGRNTDLPDQELADSTLACAALYLPESALDSKISVGWEDTESMDVLQGTLVQKFANEGRALFDGTMKDWSAGGAATNVMKQFQNIFSRQTVDSAKDFAEASIFKELQTREIGFKGVKIMDPLGEALPLVTGMTINPRTAAYFTSVEFRDYQLEFRMVPRNRGEARQIDEIIHFFQFYMLPAYYGNANDRDGSQVDPSMIGFPYEFDISIHYDESKNSKTMEHVNKFERSVITGFGVDHSPQERVMFIEDGTELYPVATDIAIHFREIVLLDRNSEQIKRAGVTDLRDPRYVRNTK